MEHSIPLLPVREFPDSGTKWLLASPENVCGLLQILDLELANRLDFSQLQQEKTSFVLDSLRRQESDLIFRAPFKEVTNETEREILIYILIEHQSTPILSMGFRLLLYMVLIWEDQRRRWEHDGIIESEWLFRPILPILFYTGDRNWTTPLSITASMDLPRALEPFIPHHKTLFLNLKATAPEKLTAEDHPFGWILRVIQNERGPTDMLMDELKNAVENIDDLTREDRTQWLMAVHYILLLIYHRREPDEHNQLTDLVYQSVKNRNRREEVSQMGQTIAQALMEEGEQRGQIRSTQSNTLDVLNARFTLSYDTLTGLGERVKRIEEPSILHQLLIEAAKTGSLEDFVKHLDELKV